MDHVMVDWAKDGRCALLAFGDYLFGQEDAKRFVGATITDARIELDDNASDIVLVFDLVRTDGEADKLMIPLWERTGCGVLGFEIEEDYNGMLDVPLEERAAMLRKAARKAGKTEGMHEGDAEHLRSAANEVNKVKRAQEKQEEEAEGHRRTRRW